MSLGIREGKYTISRYGMLRPHADLAHVLQNLHESIVHVELHVAVE
jgi:hypothetical protein